MYTQFMRKKAAINNNDANGNGILSLKTAARMINSESNSLPA